MLAHGESTRDMTPIEYLGNLILLTIGGNETTRNTITGSILALNQSPDQYQKLRDRPELIPSMVSETVRWQTPLAHMRRTATRDVELGGKRIAKGDKVVMWYVSGNRDDEVIDRPNEYIIDRERPRQHISFGFGIHRCVGNRLAEMQLRVLWEEILKRYPVIEVMGEPVRMASPFSKGYLSLPVRIPASETLAARPATTHARPAPPRPAVYRQPAAVLAAASAISAAGALLFNVIPVIMAAAAARFSLGDAEIGIVGSSYLAGFALVALTSNLWINRFNWRALIGGGTALGVAGLAGCAAIASYAELVAALFAAGAGLGLLYTVCIAVVSEHHKPDQAFGVKLATEVFLAVAVLVALTAYATPHWGFAGAALMLAGVVCVVALAALPGIPARRAVRPMAERFAMKRRAGARGRVVLRNWAPWLGLAGLFVSFAGLSGLWAFFGRMAASFGLSDATADAALTAGLVASGVAGLAATALGDRWGRARPLAAGMVLAIAGAAALALGHGVAAYLVGALLAMGLWNFPMAYQMGLIASADGEGGVAVLMPAALAIGGAVGPMLAGSLLTSGEGYLPLYAMFAVATALGLAAFVVLGRRVAAAGARP